MLKAISCFLPFKASISFYEAHYNSLLIPMNTVRVLPSLKVFLIYEMLKSWRCEALLSSVQLIMVFWDGTCFTFLLGNGHGLH